MSQIEVYEIIERNGVISREELLKKVKRCNPNNVSRALSQMLKYRDIEEIKGEKRKNGLIVRYFKVKD